MREMLLIFEGNAADEERAAELIQGVVFKVLEQENMNVKNFVNIEREPAPTAPIRSGGILQVPEFMRKRNAK